MQAVYAPDVFERSTLSEAQDIILTPEVGLGTKDRWEKETAWIMEHMNFTSGLLLDIGCGVGRLAKPLVDRGCDVIGVDSSPTMRRLAVEYVGAPDHFTAISPGLLRRLVLGSGIAFDGAFSVWAFQHFPEQHLREMLDTLSIGLRTGGALWTLERPERYVPARIEGDLCWIADGVDVMRLLGEEFRSFQAIPVPTELCEPGVAIQRWGRK